MTPAWRMQTCAGNAEDADTSLQGSATCVSNAVTACLNTENAHHNTHAHKHKHTPLSAQFGPCQAVPGVISIYNYNPTYHPKAREASALEAQCDFLGCHGNRSAPYMHLLP